MRVWNSVWIYLINEFTKSMMFKTYSKSQTYVINIHHSVLFGTNISKRNLSFLMWIHFYKSQCMETENEVKHLYFSPWEQKYGLSNLYVKFKSHFKKPEMVNEKYSSNKKWKSVEYIKLDKCLNLTKSNFLIFLRNLNFLA